MVDQEFVTVGEAAAVLRCHVETVRRLITRDELAAVKVGNRWLIDAARLPKAGLRTDRARPRHTGAAEPSE